MLKQYLTPSLIKKTRLGISLGQGLIWPTWGMARSARAQICSGQTGPAKPIGVKPAKSLVLHVLVLAVSVLFVAPIVWAHGSAGYLNSTTLPSTKFPDWMSELPDDIPLHELSIPGTHDTMAYPAKLTYIPKTQTLSIATQLIAGIRVLDIRCRHISNGCAIHHGQVYLDASLDTVLTAITDFLKAHPRETVLMMLNGNEHTAANNTRSWEDTFKAYKDKPKYKNYFWQRTGYSGQLPKPTLGDVRGKIVLIQNFGGTLYGLNPSGMDSQNYWDLDDNWSLYGKWTKVKAHLSKANSGWGEKYFKNGLSGNGGAGGAWPYFVASGHTSPGTYEPRLSTGSTTTFGLNANLYPDFPRTTCLGTWCTISFEGTNVLTYEWIQKNNPSFTGIVIADFPGPGLIREIIYLNKAGSPDTLKNRCNKESTIKSEDGGSKIDITVKNDRPDSVTISWINQNGQRRTPGDMVKSGKSWLQYSWPSHQFIVTDQSGKCVAIFRAGDTTTIKSIKGKTNTGYLRLKSPTGNI